MPVVDFVSSNSGITIRSYPHASKVIRVNFVVDKLTQAVFMHVNTASLAVMNFALNDSRVGTCFNFKAGNAVVMNVVSFKISLEQSIRPLTKFSEEKKISIILIIFKRFYIPRRH